MEYSINASSDAGCNASVLIKEQKIDFGTTDNSEQSLPNPTELFLAAFASCILKNVERFSELLKFEYDKASIQVSAVRLKHPPRLDNIRYELDIYSKDENLKISLLKRNIEKFGTIYNTVKSSCEVFGEIIKVDNEI